MTEVALTQQRMKKEGKYVEGPRHCFATKGYWRWMKAISPTHFILSSLCRAQSISRPRKENKPSPLLSSLPHLPLVYSRAQLVWLSPQACLFFSGPKWHVSSNLVTYKHLCLSYCFLPSTLKWKIMPVLFAPLLSPFFRDCSCRLVFFFLLLQKQAAALGHQQTKADESSRYDKTEEWQFDRPKQQQLLAFN